MEEITGTRKLIENENNDTMEHLRKWHYKLDSMEGKHSQPQRKFHPFGVLRKPGANILDVTQRFNFRQIFEDIMDKFSVMGGLRRGSPRGEPSWKIHSSSENEDLIRESNAGFTV